MSLEDPPPFDKELRKQLDRRVLTGLDALDLMDNWYILLLREIEGDWLDKLQQELEDIAQEIVDEVARGTFGFVVNDIVANIRKLRDDKVLSDALKDLKEDYGEMIQNRFLAQSKNKRRKKVVYSRN